LGLLGIILNRIESVLLTALFACRLRQGQPAADVQIHLRKWDFDACGLYCIERCKVKVAVHFTEAGWWASLKKKKSELILW
jgi:hypothetical protein